MSELRADMLYEIGEIVYYKTARHDERSTPIAYMITERVLQECHGGVQRLYRLGGCNEQLFAELLLTNEKPSFDLSDSEKIALGVKENLKKMIREMGAKE